MKEDINLEERNFAYLVGGILMILAGMTLTILSYSYSLESPCLIISLAILLAGLLIAPIAGLRKFGKGKIYIPSLILFGGILLIDTFMDNKDGILVFSGLFLGVVNCALINLLTKEKQ